jgi:hypothetical protein
VGGVVLEGGGGRGVGVGRGGTGRYSWLPDLALTRPEPHLPVCSSCVGSCRVHTLLYTASHTHTHPRPTHTHSHPHTLPPHTMYPYCLVYTYSIHTSHLFVKNLTFHKPWVLVYFMSLMTIIISGLLSSLSSFWGGFFILFSEPQLGPQL